MLDRLYGIIGDKHFHMASGKNFNPDMVWLACADSAQDGIIAGLLFSVLLNAVMIGISAIDR